MKITRLFSSLLQNLFERSLIFQEAIQQENLFFWVLNLKLFSLVTRQRYCIGTSTSSYLSSLPSYSIQPRPLSLPRSSLFTPLPTRLLPRSASFPQKPVLSWIPHTFSCSSRVNRVAYKTRTISNDLWVRTLLIPYRRCFAICSWYIFFTFLQ